MARDPLGIKPLYVCRNPDRAGAWSLIFASEVRAVLASGLLVRPRLDPRAVASVVWNGFVVGPTTAVEGVESLATGELGGRRRRARAGAPALTGRCPPKTASRRSAKTSCAHVVHDSVARHLESDVPLGVFLSGGIDSSAVAALAQRAHGAPVHTFTLSFDERAWNEGEVARSVAAAIGTEHRDIRLTERDSSPRLSTPPSTRSTNRPSTA